MPVLRLDSRAEPLLEGPFRDRASAEHSRPHRHAPVRHLPPGEPRFPGRDRHGGRAPRGEQGESAWTFRGSGARPLPRGVPEPARLGGLPAAGGRDVAFPPRGKAPGRSDRRPAARPARLGVQGPPHQSFSSPLGRASARSLVPPRLPSPGRGRAVAPAPGDRPRGAARSAAGDPRLDDLQPAAPGLPRGPPGALPAVVDPRGGRKPRRGLGAPRRALRSAVGRPGARRALRAGRSPAGAPGARDRLAGPPAGGHGALRAARRARPFSWQWRRPGRRRRAGRARRRPAPRGAAPGGQRVSSRRGPRRTRHAGDAGGGRPGGLGAPADRLLRAQAAGEPPGGAAAVARAAVRSAGEGADSAAAGAGPPGEDPGPAPGAVLLADHPAGRRRQAAGGLAPAPAGRGGPRRRRPRRSSSAA
jgi:hypothetical protein